MPEQRVEITPSQARKGVEACLDARRPVMLHGRPGIGKSEIISQIAQARGLHLWDLRCALLDAVDLRGIPYIQDGRTVQGVPSFLPQSGEQGILFLDEINRAPVMVQNALLQIVTPPYRLGEYQLPPAVAIVAAGNYESDGGGGLTRMPDALRERFRHLYVVPDVQDWCQWGAANGIAPVDLAFLRFRPELLSQYDKHADACPNPRAWANLSWDSHSMTDPALELALNAGSVGYGAAIERLAFLRMFRSMPSIDGILLNPTTVAVPEDVAVLYAISAALAHRANDSNFGRVLVYVARIPEEFGVFCVKDAVARRPELTSTPEFVSWGIRHQGVFS